MPKPKTDTLIALICKAITERYAGDSTAPSLLISHVLNLDVGGPHWYFTVKRYRGRYAFEPYNQLVTKDSDMDRGIRELAKLVIPADTAQRALADAVASL